MPRILETLAAQIDARVQTVTMHHTAADQFGIHLISLCVFQIAAKPMTLALLHMDAAHFEQSLERCRQQPASLLLRALRT